MLGRFAKINRDAVSGNSLAGLFFRAAVDENFTPTVIRLHFVSAPPSAGAPSPMYRLARSVAASGV